jgi:outer membrane protein assembly factor BamB
VESKSGEKIWAHSTEGPVHSAPAVWEKTAFVAGCDHYARAIDIDTGEETSQFDMGSFTAGTASVQGDRLHVGHDGGEIICLDWKKPELIWSYSNPERTFAFFSSPAIAGDCIVAGGRDRTIVCLDRATGEKRWLVGAKSQVDSSPVIAGGRVYVGSEEGALYVIDLADGTVVEKFEAGGAITASPAIAAGFLVIGTEDGDVYCLGRKD